MKSRDNFGSALAAGLCVLALGGCTTAAPVAPSTAARSIVNGPAADYPVVLGDPFMVDGVNYTPEDTMNYDRVGYLAAGDPDSTGITGAHRTLPMPSYVEVTSLVSGRTILARIERRGPMTGDRLIALSQDALLQLGAREGEPVRVRRVNPPEEHRAKLRTGEEAPLRMDTPPGLLEVLKRRLPERGSAGLADPRQQRISGTAPAPEAMATLDPDGEASGAIAPGDAAPEEAVAATADAGGRAALPRATTAPAGSEGKFAVQVGAFSVEKNAARLAEELEGFIVSSGRFALVRVGPFTSRGQAAEALAKLRARGYSDAEIRTLD